MKIKISQTNAPRIAAALATVNGRATAHTATCADLFRAVDHAEQKLQSFGLTKAQRAGAWCYYTSGGTVPSSYKYQRRINRVTLTRSSSGWSLVKIAIYNVWPNRPRDLLVVSLTPAQNDIAVAKLREGYAVQQQEAAP